MRSIVAGSTDKGFWALPLDANGDVVTIADPDSTITALGYSRFLGTDRIAQVTNVTPANLSAETDSHSDGGVLQRSDGYIRIDLPDAAWADGADRVELYITATGVTRWSYEPVELISFDIYNATPGVSISKINGSTNGIAAFSLAIQCIGHGTVDTGATATSIPIKTFNTTLDDADQLVGRIVIFPASAGTGRDLQATRITASTTTTLTVDALTRAPSEDDVFVIQ